MKSRARTRKQPLLLAAGVAVLAVAAGLALLDFPRWGTSAFTVAGLSLLLIVALLGVVRTAPLRVEASAEAPAGETATTGDTPRRLVEARRRAAERRSAGGAAKTKVRRG
ncbi:MAG TPA: hypothetical protein VF559_08060 [Caulobacteraceae bacterium]